MADPAARPSFWHIDAVGGRPPHAERSHSTLRQQIFDVAQAERETEVQPNRLLNDLGREPVTRVADFLHPLGYRAASGTASATLRQCLTERGSNGQTEGPIDRLK